MIERYNTFLVDRLFENSMNESMIYYTKEFKDTLYKLSKNNKIAKKLIDVECTDVKPDMTFIGMSDKEGYFSFTQIKKAVNAVKKAAEELAKNHGVEPDSLSIIYKRIEDGKTSQSDVNHLYNDSPWNLKNKSRSDAKIAKLVNQIFPDKYSNKEVEEFTNKFKKANTSSIFEIVEGEDIKHWYLESNYEDNSGELGTSCMRYERCSDYLNIYSKNPEVCRLLILKDEDSEFIKGRALIWKLNTVKGIDVEFYMDRIYAIDDSTKVMFQDYADEHKWLKRLNSSYSDCRDFKLGNDEYEDVKATIQLKEVVFDKYPYMDTFKRLDLKKHLLINDEDDEKGNCYIMTDTSGGYDDTSGNWSSYYGCRIPENDSVFSDPLGDWIYKDRVVEVKVGGSRRQGLYPEDYYFLEKDCVTGNWINRNDSYYSDWYDGSFLSEDGISVITGIDSNFTLNSLYPEYSTLSNKDDNHISIDKMDCKEYLSKFTSDYIAREIVDFNEFNKYYFTDFKEVVYKTDKGNFIEIDCIAFGLDKDPTKYYYTDTFSYNFNMDETIKSGLLNALKEKKSELKNIESGKKNNDLLRKIKDRIEELKKWI